VPGEKRLVSRPLLAVENSLMLVYIPSGETVVVLAEFSGGYVQLLWDERLFQVFAIDLCARSTLLDREPPISFVDQACSVRPRRFNLCHDN
jgi:hypothetical protein